MHRTGRVNQENLSIDHIRIVKSLFYEAKNILKILSIISNSK